MRYSVAVGFFALAINSALLAADDAQLKKARLSEMKAMAGHITVEIESAGSFVAAKMVESPVLRTIDSARVLQRAEDGSLWIWTHRGLPVAIVELFAEGKSHHWGHALILTSPYKTTATRDRHVWKPKATFQFKPLAGAAMPHAKAVARRIQSRKLARRFSAHIVDGRDHQAFRLLQEPIYRYQGEVGEDGAVYAFVRGESNPKALVLIQARNKKWECAVVRCSANELHVDLDGKNYWMVNQAAGWTGTAEGPFLVFYEDSDR